MRSAPEAASSAISVRTSVSVKKVCTAGATGTPNCAATAAGISSLGGDFGSSLPPSVEASLDLLPFSSPECAARSHNLTTFVHLGLQGINVACDHSKDNIDSPDCLRHHTQMLSSTSANSTVSCQKTDLAGRIPDADLALLTDGLPPEVEATRTGPPASTLSASASAAIVVGSAAPAESGMAAGSCKKDARVLLCIWTVRWVA